MELDHTNRNMLLYDHCFCCFITKKNPMIFHTSLSMTLMHSRPLIFLQRYLTISLWPFSHAIHIGVQPFFYSKTKQSSINYRIFTHLQLTTVCLLYQLYEYQPRHFQRDIPLSLCNLSYMLSKLGWNHSYTTVSQIII